MKVKLNKNIFGQCDVASNAITTYSPRVIEGDGLSDDDIRKAIQNPIGMQPLNQLVDKSQNVLIVTDDNTRHTPLKRILPIVLGELKDAGISDDKVTILIGLGTHRPMNDNEILKKFGGDIAEKYTILNHAWDNPDALLSLGECELGFEVVVNKLITEADFIISVGSIYPHATTGYSGGAKTIMTGVAGERTIENTHWMALDYSMNDILGNEDNDVIRAIYKLGRKVNIGMLVNTILHNDDRVYGIVAGDLEVAHKTGIEICKEVYGVSITEKSDIVIAEAYPADIDLRQAIKAICAADLVCRDGGVIILTADCPEGAAPQFPDFTKYGFKDPEGLYQKVESGEFPQKLMAYTLVAIGRIISERVKAILVSPNISREEALHMGFISASTLAEAHEKASKLTGGKPKTTVLQQASIMLPMISTKKD